MSAHFNTACSVTRQGGTSPSRDSKSFSHQFSGGSITGSIDTSSNVVRRQQSTTQVTRVVRSISRGENSAPATATVSLGNNKTAVLEIGLESLKLPAKKKKERKTRSTSSLTSDDEEKLDKYEFVFKALEKHNQYRVQHGVRPLRLSKELGKHAQEWARYLAKEDSLKYRAANSYGENIYCFSKPGMKIDGTTPVDSWYNEIAHYKFGENGTAATRNFTQLVWRSTYEVGFGIAFSQGTKTKDAKVYVVANYWPKGNVDGMYHRSVFNYRDASLAQTAANRFYWAGHVQMRLAALQRESKKSAKYSLTTTSRTYSVTT